MTQASDDTPRMHAINTVLAARRYFLDGASKSEIAAELGISRFKVARLLDEARRDGIVRIEIGAVPEIDVVLSRELAAPTASAARWSSARSRVPTSSGARSWGGPRRCCWPRPSRRRRGRDLVGTDAPLDGRPPARLPPCSVVQMVGSVPTLELDVNSMELVRRVAECARGPVYPLHVPLIVDSPATAVALRRDPHVQQTMSMFDRLTRAVVGIGAWTPGGSTVRAALSAEDARAADAAGAVADVCAIVLDAEGREIRTAGLPDRCIAVTADQLRAVPDVLAIAGGAAKAPAIRAALRSGLVHRLVTDEEAARLLLADGAGRR